MAQESGDLADLAFREYRGHVYRLLLRRTGNHHDAEELAQRVFADAATALRDGPPPYSMLGWLCAVAERRFIDEVRRRTVARNALRLLPRQDEAPDLAYDRAVSAALRDAVMQLPETQRQMVVMKVFEGRSFAEIAGALGTTEAACKMRLSRAVRTIRDTLREQAIGPDD